MDSPIMSQTKAGNGAAKADLAWGADTHATDEFYAAREKREEDNNPNQHNNSTTQHNSILAYVPCRGGLGANTNHTTRTTRKTRKTSKVDMRLG